jgi:hypothetical protein
LASAAPRRLHHSYFEGGEAWQATERGPSEEEKAVYEKSLPEQLGARHLDNNLL